MKPQLISALWFGLCSLLIGPLGLALYAETAPSYLSLSGGQGGIKTFFDLTHTLGWVAFFFLIGAFLGACFAKTLVFEFTICTYKNSGSLTRIILFGLFGSVIYLLLIDWSVLLFVLGMDIYSKDLSIVLVLFSIFITFFVIIFFNISYLFHGGFIIIPLCMLSLWGYKKFIFPLMPKPYETKTEKTTDSISHL